MVAAISCMSSTQSILDAVLFMFTRPSSQLKSGRPTDLVLKAFNQTNLPGAERPGAPSYRA